MPDSRRDASNSDDSDGDGSDGGLGGTGYGGGKASVTSSRGKCYRHFDCFDGCFVIVSPRCGVAPCLRCSFILLVVALQSGGRRQPASKSNKRVDSDEEDVKPPFFMAKVEKKSPSRFKKWQVHIVASVPLDVHIF